MKKSLFILTCLLATAGVALGQEVLAPLGAAVRPQSPKSCDTVTLELPFFDDFADYEGVPDSKRWLSGQAFVNKDYAPEPPSVGLVTLDALDGQGNLYSHASTNLFAADTLLSQKVRLDSLTGTAGRSLSPADSVYLSFFFLPGGWYGNLWERTGDTPNEEDSLFLEFLAPADGQWVTVWSSGGFAPDTAETSTGWPWRFADIKIEDERFFHKDFQFRFRNYASLDVNPKSGIAGNCDQWNIDYIYINHSRHAGDSTARDVAFVHKAPSMLKHYQAMPARQFTPADMAPHLELKIANRYSQTLSSNYSYTVFNQAGDTLAAYNGGMENIYPFFPNGRYQEMAVHALPPVEFAFPAMQEATTYKIVHVVREGVGGDNHTCNDTLVFHQTLDNYYAYDDGVPENGYGLTVSGSHQWLALRFDLNAPDTLTAVDFFFNRTRGGENEDLQFQLCVWSCKNGMPDKQLYKDSEKMTTQFDGMNAYHRYRLTEPVVVEDSVFIGFEQLSNDFINLGFDRSTNSRERLFYRTAGQWQQSILSGSVMMRPAFGSSALVGIGEGEPLPQAAINIYPNPATNHVTVSWADHSGTVEIYDMQGRLAACTDTNRPTALDGLSKGVYLVRVTDADGRTAATKKLIVK